MGHPPSAVFGRAMIRVNPDALAESKYDRRLVDGVSLGAVLLGVSGIAFMTAGVVLLARVRRLSDPWLTYRWHTPRPDSPSGLDPLPDERLPATTRRADVGRSQPPGLLPAADDTPADSRPAQRGTAMGSRERIPTCWKCGLHIVPGTERTRRAARWSQWIGGPHDWGAGPAANGTADVEHRDCDPHALVDEFSDYIEELRIGDSSRREAIRDEILPTLTRLDELVPPGK